MVKVTPPRLQIPFRNITFGSGVEAIVGGLGPKHFILGQNWGGKGAETSDQ
jgi:hypothetical protein